MLIYPSCLLSYTSNTCAPSSTQYTSILGDYRSYHGIVRAFDKSSSLFAAVELLFVRVPDAPAPDGAARDVPIARKQSYLWTLRQVHEMESPSRTLFREPDDPGAPLHWRRLAGQPLVCGTRGLPPRASCGIRILPPIAAARTGGVRRAGTRAAGGPGRSSLMCSLLAIRVNHLVANIRICEVLPGASIRSIATDDPPPLEPDRFGLLRFASIRRGGRSVNPALFDRL